MRETRHAKKVIMTVAFMLMLLAFGMQTVQAAAKVKRTEYEGKGRVEVTFKSRVQYKNLKITVKDSAGKKMTAKLVEKDSDEVEFRIVNYKAGKTYSYTINGVRRKGEKKYGKVTGKIAIPKAAGSIPVKEIEYDGEDREVCFEFGSYVSWKSPKVSIRSGSTEYVRSIRERDRDEIEVAVKKLTRGKTYQYTISGIKKKSSGSYTTISGSFTA